MQIQNRTVPILSNHQPFHSSNMASSELICTLGTLLPLGALFLIWGYFNFKYGWSEAFTSSHGQVAPVGSDQVPPSTTTTISPEQRMQILERMFPVPPIDGNASHAENHLVATTTTKKPFVYAYDVETNKYVGYPNGSLGVASQSCSICLEGFGMLFYCVLCHSHRSILRLLSTTTTTSTRSPNVESSQNVETSQIEPTPLTLFLLHNIFSNQLDSTACIVTGGCQHSYHRHCILDWVKVDHNDCPNCRAKMWDPEEFQRLHQQE